MGDRARARIVWRETLFGVLRANVGSRFKGRRARAPARERETETESGSEDVYRKKSVMNGVSMVMLGFLLCCASLVERCMCERAYSRLHMHAPRTRPYPHRVGSGGAGDFSRRLRSDSPS